MSFSKLNVAKVLISGIVGIGTGRIVQQIIKNNITPTSTIDKVTVLSAAWVIGGIASEATKSYTNNMIDDMAKTATKVIDKFKLDAKLGRINRGESDFETEGLDVTKFRQNPDNKWERTEEETPDETITLDKVMPNNKDS